MMFRTLQCFTTLLFFTTALQAQQVVISSYLNASDTRNEWSELLVIADNADLRNYTFGDNNENQTSWQQPVKFRNKEFWNHLRAGTIIMIWHRSINSSLQAHAIDTVKSDGYLELAANDTNYFQNGDFGSYPTYQGNTLAIAKSGDLLRILSPMGFHIHALGHKTTPGSSWAPTPSPKLNHTEALTDGEAVFVCPGSSSVVYGTLSPQSGTTYTAKSNTALTFGLPNQSLFYPTQNTVYWQSLREPQWNAPVANASVNAANDQVQLSWNQATDPCPADLTQGYLILRNLTGVFTDPVDGTSYTTGMTLGSSTVVAVIPASQTNVFTDYYNVPCSTGAYYRVYAYRYQSDGNYGNSYHVARGRAYNQTSFASVFVTPGTPVAPLSASSDRSGFCSDDNGSINLSAAGGAGNVLSWYTGGCGGILTGTVSGGGNVLTIPSPLTTTTYYVRWENGCSSSACASVTVAVIQTVTPTLSITVSQNPVCTGTTVTFTAWPVNGGPAPGFQWILNGVPVAGATSSTFSAIFEDNDQVKCILTSSLPCCSVNQVSSDIVTMAVGSSTVPVTVTINPDANPVCEGTPVAFTAIPGNGGPSPQFEWKVNGTVVFTGSAQYSFLPQDGDVVTCIMTSNSSCISGNPSAVSNPVVMEVEPLLQVSGSVSASENPSCQGALVTFSANPVNGGANPAFEWRINNLPAGSNSSQLVYVPSDNDQVSCLITSAHTCTSGNPFLTDMIVMDILPQLEAGVVVTASQNPVCTGTPVIFTATPSNGGPQPAFQWHKNGFPVGSNNAQYTDPSPVNGDVIDCFMTSGEPCVSLNPVLSNAITMSVNTQLQVGVSITASSNPVCENSVVVFTATPANGGTVPQYLWRVNGVNSGSGQSQVTFVPTNNDQIDCILTSSVPTLCSSGNPAFSNIINMVVQPNLPVSASIEASSPSVCEGSGVALIATAINGGNVPSFQWKTNGTIIPGATDAMYVCLPTSADNFSCQVTSSEVCTSGNPATSNLLNIDILPLVPVQITITAGVNPVCEGSLPVSFIANPLNGGTLPFFQWMVNGSAVGENSVQYSYSPSDNDVVMCALQSSSQCAVPNPAYSQPVIMDVLPVVPVSLSITVSDNPVCQGSSVTFSASSVNAGGNPSYQWFVNGIPAGTNSNQFTYLPTDFDQVWCIMNVTETCISGNPASSNVIMMQVIPVVPVSVTIIPSATVVCAGEPVNFTAFAPPGLNGLQFVWYVNGLTAGTNQATFSLIPSDGDVIWCMVGSSDPCITGSPATSNQVMIQVNPVIPVSVTISTPVTLMCSGTAVTFTATPFNGGSAPTYQWYLNGSYTGVNGAQFSFSPSDYDEVFCLLSSSVACPSTSQATSNSVLLTVLPSATVSITLSPSANPVCAGNQVTFASVVTNGGASPVFQWIVNGWAMGNGSSQYTYIPADNDVVQCALHSSNQCATPYPAFSPPVLMEVLPVVPLSVSIIPSATMVCAGELVNFAAVPSPGLNELQFTWYVNGQVTGSNQPDFSLVPSDGDVIWCMVGSSDPCVAGNPALSNQVSIQVNPVAPVSVTIDASVTQICNGDTVTFTAAPVNGGGNPVFHWYLNGSYTGMGGVTYSLVPSDLDEVFCQMSSSASCPSTNQATSNSVLLTVFPLTSAGITISPSSNPVCAGDQVTFTSFVINGGSSPVFQWFINGQPVGQNAASYTYIPSDGDQVLCQLTSSLPCPTGNSTLSNIISMAVSALPVPLITSISDPSDTVCQSTAGHLYSTPAGPYTFEWSINGPGETAIYGGLTDTVCEVFWGSPGPVTGSLWVTVTSQGGCSRTSEPRLVQIMGEMLSGTISPGQTIPYNSVPSPIQCGPPTGGLPPYSFLWQDSDNGISFQNIPGATGLSYTPGPLLSTRWYRLTQSSVSGCGSVFSEAVTITVLEPGVLAVQSPNGGETWLGGSAYDILWTGSLTAPVTITLYKGGNYITNVAVATASAGTYTWIIPLTIPGGNDYTIKIHATSSPLIYDFSDAPFTISPILPENRLLQNVIIPDGSTQCYDAIQTITVAGYGTVFQVQSGGVVSMIAGHSIDFLAGTTIYPGGYLHGVITGNGTFCTSQGQPGSSLTPDSVMVWSDQRRSTERFKVFPNPTSGNITIEYQGTHPDRPPVTVIVSGMDGTRVYRSRMVGSRHQISGDELAPGLWLIRLETLDTVEIHKCVRLP